MQSKNITRILWLLLWLAGVVGTYCGTLSPDIVIVTMVGAGVFLVLGEVIHAADKKVDNKNKKDTEKGENKNA